jgi:hypothetical protein
MQIGDDEEAFVFVLESNPVAQAAYVVSQVQSAGRPVAS